MIAEVGDYLHIFNTLEKFCVIGGDFNGHHSLWGSSSNNVAGVNLVEAIDCFPNLVVRNEGQPTRVTPPGTNISAVDVTIVSSNLLNMSDWSLLSDTYGSDHYPILLKLNEINNQRPPSEHPLRWRISEETNWALYSSLLESALCNIDTSAKADVILTSIIASISRVADIVLKRKCYKNINKKTSPPWWDQECSKIAFERKEALRLFKLNKNLTNFLKYKNITAQSKLLFKQKSKNSWSCFCNSLNAQTNPSIVWKRANAIQRGLMHNIANTMSVEEAEHFMEKSAPDFVPEELPSFPNDKEHFLTRDISLVEFNANIKIHGDTAPGLDGIVYTMIKRLPDCAKQLLCIAFSRILRHREDCSILKKILIVPINKQGKSNEFRAISLMSCILKAFERIMKNRLQWWMEIRGVSPQTQFGFRRGKGVTDCVAHLSVDIQQTLSKDQYLATLFLDISSAYDNVNLNILIQKMINFGFPPAFSANLIQIFYDRHVYMYVDNNLIGPRRISKGLPQGSVLSPLLFNIYTIDFHALNINTRILQYADDFCLYCAKNTFQTCLDYLSSTMDSCQKYMFENGFDITPSKSAVVIYTRHRLKYQDSLILGEFQIPWRISYKYLGIVLDQKLTWDEHISNILSKGEKSLNILKATTRRHWGTDPSIALIFYRAYTRSIIDVGCIFYGSATKTRLQKLDRLQFKALRLITGAFRSTPTKALLAECNEFPLSMRRSYLAQKFLMKNKFLSNYFLLIKISRLATYNLTGKYWIHKNSPPLAEAFTETAELDSILDTVGNLPAFESEFEISYIDCEVVIPAYTEVSSINNCIIRQVISKYPEACEIFTDGSKNNNGVGCAFWAPSKNFSKQYKCDSNLSIFTAETIAVNMALEFALNDKSFHHYLIITDSLSVLQALSNRSEHLFKNTLIKDIFEKVLTLKQFKKTVSFIWVKGHSGINGNERADKLAKEGIYLGTPIGKVPLYDTLTIIRHVFKEAWKTDYRKYAVSNPSHYTRINETLNMKPIIQQKLGIHRRHYTSLTRAMFGHGNFNSLLFKMNLVASPNCDCDGTIGDLNHLLFSCKFNENAIKYLLSELNRYNVFPLDSVSLMSLVKNKSSVRDIFFKFVDICRKKL